MEVFKFNLHFVDLNLHFVDLKISIPSKIAFYEKIFIF